MKRDLIFLLVFVNTCFTEMRFFFVSIRRTVRNEPIRIQMKPEKNGWVSKIYLLSTNEMENENAARIAMPKPEILNFFFPFTEGSAVIIYVPISKNKNAMISFRPRRSERKTNERMNVKTGMALPIRGTILDASFICNDRKKNCKARIKNTPVIKFTESKYQPGNSKPNGINKSTKMPSVPIAKVYTKLSFTAFDNKNLSQTKFTALSACAITTMRIQCIRFVLKSYHYYTIRKVRNDRQWIYTWGCIECT